MLQTTLCYLEKEDSFLMLHRTSRKDDINRDKWLGVGGKLEQGEAPEECLVREVKEETGLLLLSWDFRGIVTFVNGEQTEYMYLYTSAHFSGEQKDCDEGALTWVKKEEISCLNLWEGDRIMFRLLEERKEFFSLKLIYDGDRLLKAEEWSGFYEGHPTALY